MNAIPAMTSTYDLVAYPSYTHPQTHPGRLGVIGALFGMTPEPPGHCRVLELGCGNGSNLVPMAEGLPGSEFVGIDLASNPIAQGQRMIDELALRNIRLHQGNLTEIDATWGRFDYIIAHGVFSWVPAGVREEILRLCQRNLTPQGVAFISYNALPGSHLRLMLREMMMFHVRGISAPPERTRQALALAKFIAEAQPVQDEYQAWMKAELERILAHDAGHIFHDELAEYNEPCFFTQFAGLAGRHGLQYVGEADFFEMFGHGLTESARQGLAQIGSNRLLREQYLDFLKCRRFRQTLLCHQDLALKTEAQAEPVVDFFISSSAACASERLRPGPGPRVYTTPKGATCTTDFPLGQAALSVLEQHWPAPLPFSELVRLASLCGGAAVIPPESAGDSSAALAKFLLQLYGAGLVEFRTCAPAMVSAASEHPVSSPIARWQARHGDVVSSRFHQAVKVEDEVGRCLLSALDGTMDRPALLEKLRRQFNRGDSPIFPVLEDQKAGEDLEKNLAKLASLGLLVA